MHRTSRPLARLARDEDGSISILTALSTTLLLLALAFAIDVGSIVLGDRDIQGVVDLAALDAVSALGPLASGDPEVRAAQLAAISAAENAGWSDKDGTTTMTTQIGTWDDATGTFIATPVGANAVLVSATSVLERPFGIVPGVDTVTHTAVAELTEAFQIDIGTTLASVDTGRSELLSRAMSGLFGGPVTLDAVGWQGLADTSIPLNVLMTELNVGSVDELLALEVTAPELLRATARGLRSDGSGLTVSVAHELDEIAAVVDTVNGTTADLPRTGLPAVDGRLEGVVRPVPSVPTDIERTVERDRRVRVGDILAIDEGLPGAVLDARFNIRSLVTGTAMLVNGNNVVDLGIDLSGIPGVTAGSVTMTVIEPAQDAYGRPGQTADGAWRTQATTGQLRFGVELLTDRLGTFAGFDVGHLAIPIGVDAGNGSAALQAVGCDPVLEQTWGRNLVETTAASMSFGATTPSVLGNTAAPLPPRADRVLTVVNARLDQLGLPGLGLPAVPVEIAAVEAYGQHVVPGNAGSSHDLYGPFPSSVGIAGPAVLPDAQGVGLTRVFNGIGLQDIVNGIESPASPQPIYNPLTGAVLYRVDVDNADQLTIHDPVTGAVVHSVNLRNDVVAPALATAASTVQRVDAEVVRPLLEVLGVATVADADTSVLDHRCGTRRLVR